MNKKRTIKELLQLMLDNQDYFIAGLCGLIFNVYSEGIISEKEYEIIKSYLNEKKPINAGRFWFTRGEIQPRIEWLEQQIDKL